MTEKHLTPWRASLWEKLREQNPETICYRAGVTYSNKSDYAITFLNNHFHIYPDQEKITTEQETVLSSYHYSEFVLLSYLVHAQDIPLSHNWISEKELPGGSTFFQGPHRLYEPQLIERFGNHGDKFLRIGKGYGGQTLAYGDVSLAFSALPRISLALVLWLEDDEFPARITYLFDSHTSQHFALDVVYALCHCVNQIFLAGD